MGQGIVGLWVNYPHIQMKLIKIDRGIHQNSTLTFTKAMVSYFCDFYGCHKQQFAQAVSGVRFPYMPVHLNGSVGLLQKSQTI